MLDTRGATQVRRDVSLDFHATREQADVDPPFVITRMVSLEEGPDYYKKFRDKEDGVIKVVLKPDRNVTGRA